MEGVSPSSSAQVQAQVQDRGKRSTHEEVPSGGHDIDVTFTDVDRSSPGSELKEIIQEQKDEINNLNDKLLRVEWVINYLEQRNKQLEDEHTLI